jgi:uncharacterized protein YhjY with autotransporter beta-barrel domain/phospholipase/lecithinase/hemolysin
MFYKLLSLLFYKIIVSYFIIFNLTFIITLNLLSNSSLADESTAVFFFGDSDNDTGYFSSTTGNCKDWTTDYTVCGAITGDGVTTIGTGYHWVNVFSDRFGTTTTSVNSTAINTSNKTTTNGGNNYAATGAKINQINTLTEPGVWSLANQVDRYLLDYGGKADKNALYSFDVTNDLKFNNDLTTVANGSLKNYIVADNWRLFAQGSGSDGYLQTQSTSGVDWTITSYTELVTDYTNQAIKLKNAGARYILVEMEVFSAPTSDQDVISSLYDTSSAMSNAFIISDTGYANITTYNKAVLSDMKAEGVNVIPFDDYSTTMHVIRNYADYGFSDYGMSHVACSGEVAALTGGWTSANCGTSKHASEFASDSEAYSAALNQFFFADTSHKAPAFLRIEADVKYNLIAAPVQIGMLSESSLQSKRSFHQDLQNQIIKSATNKKKGNEILNFWTESKGSNQEYDTHKTGFADIKNGEFSTSLGMDYAINDDNLIIGGSLSFFNRQIDYSDGRGSYKQDEHVLSLYSAFTKDNFWSNAAVSYGFADNTIKRKSPLGITTQTINGDTNSKNFSAQISTGYNFENRFSDFSVIHSPIANLTYQKIYQDGFTEKSDVVLLALSFEDYNISSFEGEVGYQIQAKTDGIFQPFAIATIRHEFDDVENKITAAITSSTDYNQNYNIYMPVKNVNYRNYKVGTNVEFKNNFFGSIYHESAYGNSKKIYQNLVAKLKYSF